VQHAQGSLVEVALDDGVQQPSADVGGETGEGWRASAHPQAVGGFGPRGVAVQVKTGLFAFQVQGLIETRCFQAMG
jgi:hypothetical protein